MTNCRFVYYQYYLHLLMILVWTKRLKKYMDNYKPATRNGLVLDFMLRRVDHISNLENLVCEEVYFLVLCLI
jgi:hypothetical protein